MSIEQAVARDVAMTAHEATLVPGTRARVTRGRWDGMVGTVVDTEAQGSRCVTVDLDGVGMADISCAALVACP